MQPWMNSRGFGDELQAEIEAKLRAKNEARRAREEDERMRMLGYTLSCVWIE